jgi:hypothetical protein
MSDGRAQRHYRRRARVDEPPRHHQVVVRIRQHHEPLAHQLFSGFQQLRCIRKKRLLIADHFQLHPIRESHFAAQPRRADGLVGVVAAGRIGQQKVLVSIHVVQQRLFAAVGQVHPPHRHGHHVGAGSLMRPAHLAEAAIFPRAHDQARTKRAAGNHQCIVHKSRSPRELLYCRNPRYAKPAHCRAGAACAYSRSISSR